MARLPKALVKGVCATKEAGLRETYFSLQHHNDSLPKDATLASLLKACATRKDLHTGNRLHSTIVKLGLLETNNIIGNALVSVYVKCGAFARAQGVFDQLPARDVASWTSLIAGYAGYGRGKEALHFFKYMQGEGVAPNALTFASTLKACGGITAVDKGRELHALIISKGLLGTDVVLGNALLDMYAKCGAIAQAQHMFGELPIRNVVSWNALIAGCCQQGKGEVALHLFKQLKGEGLYPDAVTFLCIVKACGNIGSLEKGLEIHTEIVRRGLLEKYTVLPNALVDMYAKCGAMQLAQEVLEELSRGSVVSWTALMTGYCQLGRNKDALTCFQRLKDKGLSPNAVTYLCVLKACGSSRGAEAGKKIHDEIVHKGLLETDYILGSALVDMYAKCGELAKAQEVFEELPVRDIVSWTALLTEYCLHDHGEKALECFERMQFEGFSPDPVTFVCILNVCASIGAADKGKEVHAEIARQGLLGKIVNLASALVDMYAKCDALIKAQEVFDKLPAQDVASWTALISGYGQIGLHDNVIRTFNQMMLEGTEPNLVTFMVVLSACGVLGLVDEGQTYYDIMSSHYGIFPTSEHNTCMVNLFGQKGQFDKALTMLQKIHSPDRLPAWSALLSACKKSDNMKLARLVFEHAVCFEGESAVGHIHTGNLYASTGSQITVNKTDFIL